MSSRLNLLRRALDEEKLDAVLISSIPNIIYFTNFSDFTTLDRDGYLLITKKNQYIFTHGIYKEAVEKHVKDFTFIHILRENPISVAIKKIVLEEKIKELGFESFDLKVNEYEKLIEEVDEKILKPTNIIYKLRIQKTPKEIEAIKKACEIGDKAFDFILSKIKLGISEIELAVELEFFIKRRGAVLSFDSVVAFGENASKPHHVPTATKLKQNSFALIDFGVKLDNYCSDMTRTIFFGKPTSEQKNAYQAILQSQEKAETFIKEKLKIKEKIIGKEVDAVSRNYLIQKGFASMPHSLGHGIGLEVHESPRLTILSEEILKNGMVFTLEPGVYIPGRFGIRIEDIYVIEENKLVQLTKSPKTLVIL